MVNNDHIVLKYPFLSSAPNLFDYFLIIGYDQIQLQNEIFKPIEDNSNNISDQKATSSFFKSCSSSEFFTIRIPKERPIVLNSICPNSEREAMLDENDIIKFIFPEPPSFYYDNNKKEQYTPNHYNVVFSINCDVNTDLSSKKTLNGYSYIFYEVKEKKIDSRINKDNSGGDIEFDKKNSMIDSVKTKKVFIPKAFCFISQYPFYSQYSKIAQKLLTCFLKPDSITIPLEILIYNIINFTPSPLKSKILYNPFPEQLDNKSFNDTITFHQLSGYPVFDFCLSEIFSILPIEIIVEILIFNSLEIDMIFFSKNIEVLNIVMYIISSLNYPLNDSIYYNAIASETKGVFEDKSNRNIGKPSTAMLGINCSYSNDINIFSFSSSVYVADLDNKKFTFKVDEKDKSEDNENIEYLSRYIRDIITLRKTINDTYFERSLLLLMNELESKAKKVIHLNVNQSNQFVPKFLNTDNTTHSTNKMIQELFYEFNLNILYLLYQFVTIKEKISTNNDYCIKRQKEKDLPFELKILCELIQNGNKVNVFFDNFIQEHVAINVYKIPLIFTEEFLHMMLISKDKEKFKLGTFDIMDKFYIGKESHSEQVNFSQFFSYYNKELKEEYNNYMRESQYITPKTLNKRTIFQYKTIELDNEILFKYIYHLQKLSDQKLLELFPSLSIQKGLNSIERIQSKLIINQIEKSLLTSKLLLLKHLTSINFIMFYAMTYNQNDIKSLKELGIISILKNLQYVQRKYLIMLLELYHRAYIKTKNPLIIDNGNELINHIIEQGIIPNEEMMTILGKYSLIKRQLKDSNTKNTSSTPLNNQRNNDEELFNLNNWDIYSKKQLFLKKNICKDGSLKEDKIMTYAQNTWFDGNLKVTCEKCSCDVNPHLYFQEKKNVFETPLYSALKILNKLFELYKKNKMTFDEMPNEDIESFCKITLNLLFYLKNVQVMANQQEKNLFEYYITFYLKKYLQRIKK